MRDISEPFSSGSSNNYKPSEYETSSELKVRLEVNKTEINRKYKEEKQEMNITGK